MDALKLLSRSTAFKSRVSNNSPQHFPSASGTSAVPNGNDSVAVRKRKRSSEPDHVPRDFTPPQQPLSEDEVRQIQKKHRIKIVDLKRFRKAGKSSDSRKVQKEQSRVFPQPLTGFGLLRSLHHVNAALVQNIVDQAFHDPTEVQMATLPLLLHTSEEGAEPDLLTVAPTGSGKTLAFLIPLVDKISRRHRENADDRHTRAVILAPTKELVSQIVNEGRKLCAKTGVTITAMRKGMRLFEGDQDGPANATDANDDSASEASSSEETETRTTSASQALVKADIVVSTPLSLVRVLCPSWGKEDEPTPVVHPLPKVETLILDEADVLLDPLFRSQTLAVWSACTSPSMRVSMWSATIGSNVEELAVQTISERHKRLKIRRAQRPPLLRTIIGIKDTSLPSISHRLTYTATESGKLLGMRQLLRPPPTPAPTKTGQASTAAPLRPPFLVFTQTIDRAQSLYNELQYDIPASAGGAARVAVLHSSLPDRARSGIMQSFRQGKIWILITTDLLSRGVDFRGVNVVVNYDIPTTVAGYVHRAGRTGRAGRKGGVCVSFYTKEDVQYVKGIANVIAASEKAQSRADGAASATGGTSSMSSTSTSDVQPWLLHALPSVSKSARKDLKLHGVQSRRGIRADDDDATKRLKRKARIGTQSGYEKREVNRKRAAVEASRLRTKTQDGEERDGAEGGDWQGF